MPVLRHAILTLGALLALDGGRGDAPPHARVEADPRKGEMVIELAPVDLPTAASHHGTRQPPVALAQLPAGGAIFGFRVELVDAEGRMLPAELVHHFNLIDPDHRELFLPISRRVIAAGQETGAHRLPWLLFGVPIKKGDRLIASAMLHNPTTESYRGVRTRLVLFYTPDNRPWPLFDGFPWQLDAAFPVGDKSWDLLPGYSSRSYEGSPAVPGKIAAMGGHLHEYGVGLEFADATTGEVIWRAQPVTDSVGRVVSVPVGKLFSWNRLGHRIVPEHRYRVTVHYENPTGRVLPGGGMGVVGGLFIPDRGVTWPAADTTDGLYRRDVEHVLRLLKGGTPPAHQLAGSSQHTHH